MPATKSTEVTTRLNREAATRAFEVRVALPSPLPFPPNGESELVDAARIVRPFALAANVPAPTYMRIKTLIYDGRVSHRRERGRLIVVLGDVLAELGIPTGPAAAAPPQARERKRSRTSRDVVVAVGAS